MTTEATVAAFLTLVTERPDIAAEFIRVRELWQQAQGAHSRELAKAAGAAFAHVCALVGIARGRDLDPAEEQVIRDLVNVPPTALERAN